MSLQEDYFLALKNLLAKEKQSDLEQYNKTMTTSSFKEKISKGLCWEPLLIKETGYGLGDYPFVVVERVKNKDSNHQFSAGKQVNLYLSGGEPSEKCKGTIHFVSGNTMKLILSANDLPDWVSAGRIGAQLLFDDKSYEEMETTLDKLVKSKDPQIESFIELILAKKPQKKFSPVGFVPSPHLNESQNDAVKAIMGNQDICIVHGPPGTGKTTTLVEAIKRLTVIDKRILVCAPSNAAADLLTEKLAQKGVNVIRIGNLSRVDESVVRHTVDFRKISSYNFSASRTFRNEKERAHVIRAQFFNEHEGSYITNPRVYLNYAYQIPLTETLKAFSGVSFGTAGIYYSAPTTTQSSFFLPDASFGLGLKSNWFEVGASAMQLFNGSFTPVANPVLMKRYYHAYGSVQKEWPSEWMIKAYALGRFVPSVSSEYFGAFSISYAKQVTLGTSIKYGAGLSFFTMLGIDNKEDKLQLLLNYNSPFFSLIPAYQSNIEIGLAYVLE